MLASQDPTVNASGKFPWSLKVSTKHSSQATSWRRSSKVEKSLLSILLKENDSAFLLLTSSEHRTHLSHQHDCNDYLTSTEYKGCAHTLLFSLSGLEDRPEETEAERAQDLFKATELVGAQMAWKTGLLIPSPLLIPHC